MLASPATPPARGQHRVRTKGNMSLICWYNKGHFRFLTNAYSPLQQGGCVWAGGSACVSTRVCVCARVKFALVYPAVLPPFASSTLSSLWGMASFGRLSTFCHVTRVG